MTIVKRPLKGERQRIKQSALISTAALLAAMVGTATANASEKVIYNFTGGTTDGGNPYAGLIDDGSGNLYGAAFAGGASGQGVIYEITTSGTFTPLASLPGGANGGGPTSPPMKPISGVIYGTAAYDSVSAGVGSGDGVLYEISSPGGYNPVFKFSSSSGANGANPFGGLSTDNNGHLFGTTYNGGSQSLTHKDWQDFRLAPTSL